jgi:transposase-like protein
MTRKSKSIKYSKDFQDSAIRLSSQPGRTVASVAEELKIPAWRLHNWISDGRQYELPLGDSLLRYPKSALGATVKRI